MLIITLLVIFSVVERTTSVLSIFISTICQKAKKNCQKFVTPSLKVADTTERIDITWY